MFGEISYGQLIIAATDKGVCFLHFGDDQQTLFASLQQEFPQAALIDNNHNRDEQLSLWLLALQQHITDNSKACDIPLHIIGSLFQLKVWRFLTKIGAGQTVSYKQLAQGIGNESAQRAVANACGKNNIALLVPCHRVIRADGKAGGYRWGEVRKQAILAHESSQL